MFPMNTRICVAILTISCVVLLGKIDKAVAGATTMPAATQSAATQATTAPVVINWDQAAKHVGEKAVVTGPVMGTHVTTGGKALILNVGRDFPDKSRFTVMIATDDKNPADEEKFSGKTVTVTGEIELYRKVPEIKAAAKDVIIVPDAPGGK